MERVDNFCLATGHQRPFPISSTLKNRPSFAFHSKGESCMKSLKKPNPKPYIEEKTRQPSQ